MINIYLVLQQTAFLVLFKSFICFEDNNAQNDTNKYCYYSRVQILRDIRESIIYLQTDINMNEQSNPIDLNKLKALIHTGIEAIPVDKQNAEAVIMIGDTGVGKSTIMSFLSGSELVVRFDGLKPILDTAKQTRIKIGHEKYSETSIPTKVVIEKMAFYDCPGFKDNKGEQFEISNSFFVQRLLDIYQKVKIVLVVDQSHISEARADKLPKLVRNLHKSFKTFEDIKDGCCMIINRAGRDNTQQDYHQQIARMIQLKNQNGYLFQDEERRFLEFMISKKRILLFKQAAKQNRDRTFIAEGSENRIMDCIKKCQYVKSRHIQNILSESAKLAIRDFIDEITTRSNYKIELICAQIIQMYSQRVQSLGRDVNAIIALKQEVIRLAQEIKSAQKESIIDILQRQMPRDKIQDFEEDFASVMFFKGIYDKTSTYFSNLINKIYSELAHLLTKLDKRITVIQKENEQEKEKQKERVEQRMREQKRQQEKIVAMEHCSRMDDLKVVAQTLVSSKRNLIEEIKSAMRCLASVEEELRRVKSDAMSLQSLNKEIETEFTRIQQTYFTKKPVA